MDRYIPVGLAAHAEDSIEAIRKRGMTMQPRVKSHIFRRGSLGECDRYDLDQQQVKASLARQVVEALCMNGRTQLAAAETLGIDQPKVSRLLNGHLAEFSTERLLRFLTLLGSDVEIVVRRPITSGRRQTGRLRVVGNG